MHTLNLAEALAEQNVDVTVHSLARGGDTAFFRPVADDVNVRVYPFPDVDGESVGQRILRSIATLSASLTMDSADIVHAQDCISANAVADCVRTVHHIDNFTTPELVECHDRAIRRPFAHVCVSQSVATELSLDWGINATVIPNGVDADRFGRAAADDNDAKGKRASWRSLLGARFILTVGGIEPRKGTIDLVEAMAIVQQVHPDVPLVIAGGETLFDYRDYREEFDRRCETLGVHPILLGPVEDDLLPSLVAACDVFAFPSVKEGFGLAPMEALAAGRPLVCRSLPVLEEVFAGAAGFASTVEDFAARLIEVLDGPIDESKRHSGQQLASTHSWERAAIDHVAFYRKLLQAPSSQTRRPRRLDR